VDEWEGKVNAWPLDEGLIDYVDSSYGKSSDENPLYTLNVVAHNTFNIGGRTVNATEITPKLLAEELHEAQEVEANVATGYHAIEFLLWGQDLNGTNAGAGNRKASDFDVKNCTNGHCDRRVQYLVAATDLLVSDLQDIVAAWGTGGQARTDFMNKTDAESLSTILTGLGSLSYGELAGERIKLGLMLNDPEEEHDCFSDNTHNSHYYDEVGMKAIYTGVYRRVDGSVFKGPALKDYAEIHAPAANAKALAGIETAMSKMTTMKRIADSGEMAYDQMIGAGNTKGNAVVMDVVNSLVVQTRGFEAVVAGLNLNIEVEGSDSLDNPSAVQ
jgi:putative iron-regulated protein